MCRPDFSGMTVFVSGGSSGIGETLCKQLIQYNAKKVIISARRIEELERVRQESGAPDRVECFKIDLSDPKLVMKELTQLFQTHKIDILINNGGVSIRDEFKNLSFDVLETVINTNLLSQIAATKAVLPGMIERRLGHIVNICSAAGISGVPFRTIYSASKFGLSGFGKAVRSEVSQHGVQVLNVYPGYVQTQVSHNSLTGDGNKFGRTDNAIKNGMSVDECC